MQELVDQLIFAGMLRSPRIIDAMRNVDRRAFMPPAERPAAYVDEPRSIGYGQTISQPTTVALMLELLSPDAGHTVLDIGSGSGWTSALLSRIVGPTGSVIGCERVFELAEFGRENCARCQCQNVAIHHTPTVLGASESAPYDRILVSAAAQERVPQELADQLRAPGILVLPVAQSLLQCRKLRDGSLVEQTLPGFLFVPLVTG